MCVDGFEPISDLIKRYVDNDSQIKELKKICDKDKESLKIQLARMDVNKVTSNGYTVQRIVSEKETLDEEKLLPIIKHYWSSTHGSMECPYIKTREYIDMEALENAIYQKELTPSVLADMDKCREVTTVVTLRCKKA
jgi:hypothetical protein